MRYSFRFRLLFAFVLWTLGLFVLVHGLSVEMLIYFPSIERWARSAGALVFAAGFMVAGFTFGKGPLSKMRQLRESLTAVRDGRAPRVVGSYPSEIQPLVDDLNALLERREQDVRRAQAKAADLAHGLKTPLALLTREAEDAHAGGRDEQAARIAEQVERMRRQVDYHLAHARAAASGPTTGVSTKLRDALDSLARTLDRLYADSDVALDLDASPEHTVRCERQDLDEMLGNLLDNAFKWAAARVSVRVSARDRAVTVSVDDDGPGIPEAQRDAALRRGVSLDDAVRGTGFGLAIASELAELYGGALELDDSPLGGLRARLTLPAR
jgi:signal transduction histidine kinase